MTVQRDPIAQPDPTAPLAAPQSPPGAPLPADARLPSGKPAGSWKLGIVALGLSSAFLGYNWVVDEGRAELLAAVHVRGPAHVLRRAQSCSRCWPSCVVPLKPQALGTTIVFGLLYTTIPIGLSMWALETGGAGHVSVLTYVMPFWLLFLAWLFLGERLRGLQWPAAGMAFLGLILVASPWRAARGGEQPDVDAQQPVAGGQHDRRQTALRAPRHRHPLVHHLADALRLAAPHRHRRLHLGRARPSGRRRSPGRCSTTWSWPGRSPGACGSTRSASCAPATPASARS